MTEKIFILFLLECISFVICFVCIKYNYNKKKKYLISQFVDQKTVNNPNVLIMDVHPLILFFVSYLTSVGFCFFLFVLFFLFSRGEALIVILCCILSLLSFSGYIFIKSFSLLIITDAGIYPIFDKTKNNGIIDNPIFFDEIYKIEKSFSINSGLDLYICLKNGENIRICGMYYSKEIKTFIGKKIERR